MASRSGILCPSLTLLLTFLAVSAQAQTSCTAQVTCAGYSMYYASCEPPLPPTAYNCTNDGPFEAICDVPTYQCSPAPCPTCNTASGGGPINLATGNTDIHQSDVLLPGLGGGLTLSRTWNSQTAGYGLFGQGWASNLEERIYVGDDHLAKYVRGNGSIWSYGWSSYTADHNGHVYYLAGPKNGGDTLQVDTATWTLAFKTGEKKIFDLKSGDLLSLTDRNGNTTQLTYDTEHQRITVTDPASRHLYLTYIYFNLGNFGVNLVTNVTSDFGISLSYQYNGMAQLVKVIRPDNTFVTFEYSGNLITAVKDSDGKILESHTYDLVGRGLTSSRAGGADALTISYEQ